MSRSYSDEAGGPAEGAALVKTCRLVLTPRTSKELVLLEQLKGLAGDETGHINIATRGAEHHAKGINFDPKGHKESYTIAD